MSIHAYTVHIHSLHVYLLKIYFYTLLFTRCRNHWLVVYTVDILHIVFTFIYTWSTCPHTGSQWESTIHHKQPNHDLHYYFSRVKFIFYQEKNVNGVSHLKRKWSAMLCTNNIDTIAVFGKNACLASGFCCSARHIATNNDIFYSVPCLWLCEFTTKPARK